MEEAERTAMLQTGISLRSAIQALHLKMVGSAGNAPVRRFRRIFIDTGFTDQQPDHFP
jgi:hypothetical protein